MARYNCYQDVLIFCDLNLNGNTYRNRIEYYWSQNRDSMPRHTPAQKAMARDRFKQIHNDPFCAVPRFQCLVSETSTSCQYYITKI
jgi:hypothetical protein